MKKLALIILFVGCWNHAFPASECDGFVAWVAAAKDAYQEKHRIYPVPKAVEDLALRYMPRLWVHPGSWQPIDFEDYLAISKLISKKDGKVIKYSPSVRDLGNLSYDEQCSTYLNAEEINPRNPAPVYIQVFWDENPADFNIKWTYIKYNLVFDWSGLASKMSWLSKIGTFLSGGDKSRWHRLDIHLAMILAFDPRSRLRMLTLAQHNHQQTYLPGLDFEADDTPILVAAFRSNELYLDKGEKFPVSHRVVPFFSDVAYLIDPAQKPAFWAIDVAYGRNAGGKEVELKPVFIEPRHPLANFAGLLAPPRRLMGKYIGRDGPPGYDYYAPPAYIPLANFAAMGYWREGDQELLQKIKPLIGNKSDMHGTDWRGMVAIMRHRLADAMIKADDFLRPR